METAKNNISLDWQFWFYWINATTFGWVVGNLFFSALPVIIAGGLIGAFQAVVLRYKRLTNVWQWMMLSFVGWMFGNILSTFFFQDLPGPIMGLTTGLAQWFYLRKRLHLSGWWIIINIIGWTTGLNLLPGILTSGALPSAITGLALIFLLNIPQKKQELQ